MTTDSARIQLMGYLWVAISWQIDQRQHLKTIWEMHFYLKINKLPFDQMYRVSSINRSFDDVMITDHINRNVQIANLEHDIFEIVTNSDPLSNSLSIDKLNNDIYWHNCISLFLHASRIMEPWSYWHRHGHALRFSLFLMLCNENANSTRFISINGRWQINLWEAR